MHRQRARFLRRACCFVLCLSSAAACRPQEPQQPITDHHVHMRSPKGAWIERQLGDHESTMTLGAAEVMRALGEAKVDRAFILSDGYFFGSPFLPDGLQLDPAALAAAENDFVANEAARYPDNLFAFCSVNPVATYAPDIVRQCGEDRRIVGLKLHFTNSGVDLRDENHRTALGKVFEIAAASHLTVLIHMRTGDEWGAPEIDLFVDLVGKWAPDTSFQIAHLAGWGAPYDFGTDAALEAFFQAFQDGRLKRENFTFDIAAMIAVPEIGEDGQSTPQLRQLVSRIRQIGIDRIVFGSDWTVAPIPTYVEIVRKKESLPLEPKEIEAILRHQTRLDRQPVY